jgi:hypothetical protein
MASKMDAIIRSPSEANATSLLPFFGMAELTSTTDIITEEYFNFTVNSPDNFSDALATTETYRDYVLSEASSGPPSALSLSGLGLDLHIPTPSSLRSPDSCLQSRPTGSSSTSTLSSPGASSSGSILIPFGVDVSIIKKKEYAAESPAVCCQVVPVVFGTRPSQFELNISSCYTVFDIKQNIVEIVPFCCRFEECELDSR